MATLYSTGFTAADGLLDSQITGWDRNGFTFNVESNQCRNGGSPSSFNCASTNTSALADVADCKVTVKLVTGAGADGGPCVRLSSGGANCYYLDAEQAAGGATLYRRVAGADTNLGTRSFTHSANDTYGLEVSGSGATVTIKAYRNGVQLGADFTDTNAARITAAGQTGIASYVNQLFDDFLVEDLGGGGGGPALTGPLLARPQMTLLRM